MTHSCHLLSRLKDTPTTYIYSLSLHDALPISAELGDVRRHGRIEPHLPAIDQQHEGRRRRDHLRERRDRKSTRLNSSHLGISYAVFCLKKKKKKKIGITI